jgi:multidrug efflux system membrane fusion protein
MNPSHAARATVLAFLSFSACQTRSSAVETSSNPVAIRTAEVSGSSEGEALRFSAVVQPARQVEVDFKMSGYVRTVAKVGRRLIQEGDRVNDHQVLAEIDKADYEVKVSTATAAVAEAKAGLAQSQLDLRRANTLLQSLATTQAQVDALTTQVSLGEARLARAHSALREASLAYQDSTLRSPMNGTVLKRMVEEGALVGPRYPGFVIADLATVKLVFSVPDYVLPSISVGRSVPAIFDAENLSLSGTVTRIAPVADDKSRTFDIEITLSNDDQSLRPGLVGSVVLSSTSRVPLISVPIDSLVRGKEPRSIAVYTVDDQNRAMLRPVKVVSVARDHVLVEGPLKKGDRVATLGSPLLWNGADVVVIP